MTKLKDWRGTLMDIGCVVVYPTRQGSSMEIHEAQVVSVETVEGYRGDYTKVGVRRLMGWGLRQKMRTVYPLWERVTVIG